jgi:hypothetical protein
MLGLQQTVLLGRRTPRGGRKATVEPMSWLASATQPRHPPRQLALTATRVPVTMWVIFVCPQLHLQLRCARLSRIRLYPPEGVSRNEHDPACG